MPMIVDTIDDQIGARYSGMPSRLYLIDARGKVVFKNGRGPFGFKPAELEHALLLHLQDEASEPKARVPLLNEQEAWQCLPAAQSGYGGTLPLWARALARSLPRTTAAMLELDYKHRTRSPLDPILRAKMHLVAARANQSPYGVAYAEADLRRAGLDASGLKQLAADPPALAEPGRSALEFARKMSLDASTVTDMEVAHLMALHGEEKVAAMVLLLAYANFQDRLLLALGIPVEPGGPLEPLPVKFGRISPPPLVPPRALPRSKDLPSVPERVADSDWLALDVNALKNQLEGQKSRPGRIRVPAWDEVVTRLPAGYPFPKRPLRIQWSLVCLGYQPELATAWSACTRAFGEEANQDRVFEESLFWVVTRTIHCFY
jgi:alkylhydroperoxidase family enzyme